MDPRGFKQQAMIHCAYCNEAYDDDSEAGLLHDRKISVHGSWLFFPFHRWYLYFFERILGDLLDDSDFALPYWNWDHPAGMTMPPMFETNKLSPLYGENRDQKLIPPAILNLASKEDNGITDEQKINNNLSMIHSEMIGGVRYPIDFMGQPYRAGDNFPSPMRGGTSERGSHTGVHRWVGNPKNEHNEDLGSFHSAGRDPLFYCHHANVDRMWTIWKNQLDTSVPRNINDPDFLNSSFLFYDEKRQLRSVTVADCLDNTKLGYVYEKSDTSHWENISLKREGPRADFEELSKLAEKDVTYPITLHDTLRTSSSIPRRTLPFMCSSIMTTRIC
ncbi:hypothetical protein C2S52_021114 [Perilla frutescens var. hirtella]|nr:hypothetical protein C2S52_021114 [Perilla frutescens var. hirtella]